MTVFALVFIWSIHLYKTLKKKIIDGHDGQYTYVIIVFLIKKNRRKKKNCSVSVFALVFIWSIHLYNTLKKNKLSMVMMVNTLA